ncbi:MAG: trehalose-6-phosphate synthase, partial [Waddliaceae bacterium]
DGCLKNDSDISSFKLIDTANLNGKNEEGYQLGCIPLSKNEVDQYYNCFSNQTLWALFHYFFEKSALDYSTWAVYEEVNQRFAAYIDQVAEDDDIVWIQDYHLFLVPQFLRSLRPRLKIHFFLHIPFPHNDIFSILPWSRQILESMLCCNSIGFHHRQYLANFEESITSHQLVNAYSQLFVNPISVDFTNIDSTSKSDRVSKRSKEIRKEIGVSKMLIGVDRIDYSKGIKERLLAIEWLLKESPELRGKFIFHQIVVPSRESVGSYRELKREVDEIVGRINGTYSTDHWIPIHYHYHTVSFEDLIALYLAADIALVTPLRDGMNLVCKEFVAAHSDDDGILILSRFAGAYAELQDCLVVNPYNIEEVKNTIYKAIHMPKEERVKRMQNMRKSIQSHDIHSWMKNCAVFRRAGIYFLLNPR